MNLTCEGYLIGHKDLGESEPYIHVCHCSRCGEVLAWAHPLKGKQWSETFPPKTPDVEIIRAFIAER